LSRDTDRELERLQKALLEEEEEEIHQDHTPMDMDTDIADTEIYQNHAGSFRAYNSDRADVDLDAYSQEVLQPKKQSNTFLVCLLILLTGTLVLVVLWLLGRMGGLL